MTVSIGDVLDLNDPQPRSIRLYLRMHGWSRVNETDDGPGIWQLPTGDGTYEIISPSSRSTHDFKDRVADLLRTLSIAEGRSPADVLGDMSTQGFDVQHIRRESAGPPGTAPLRDAADAYSAIHAVYAASTSSLEEPRPVHPPYRTPQANSLMRQVLAGPTGAGSYVLTVWTPVPPRLTQEEDLVLFELDDEPYERRATLQLHRSLVSTKVAVRRVLDGGEGVDAFLELVPSGVSANLCESLVKFAGSGNEPFDVRFTWAIDRPTVIEEPIIRFEAASFPILSEAAREIRKRIPKECSLRGQIVRLHRESNLGSGEVTISGSLIEVGETTGRQRRVIVDLSESDYAQAIYAHRERIDIEVLGALEERGTHARLLQVHGFQVLPELTD